MHDIRSAYGWTDEQILDHVELYGFHDLIEMWKLIREDEVSRYRMLISMAPLHRTPMDKGGASSLNKYSKKLEKNLDALVPWQSRAKTLAGLNGKVESGKVTVLLDGDEIADQELFKDANVKRE